MTTAAPVAPTPLIEQQHIVLDDVSWQLYEHLLEEIGDRPIRMTFDQGNLEIMSPLPKHERWKGRIAQMVEILEVELNISMEPLGSTTFAREDLAKGLEPDECYYVQHAADVRGKDRLDLTVDPPPDLAIEIDITRRSIAREPIYAALGVPELWRFNGRQFRMLLLGADGTYQTVSHSAAFPFLPASIVESFIRRLGKEQPAVVLRDFRDWVRTLPSRQ